MTWRPVVTAVCAVLLAAGAVSCTPAAESAPSTAQSVVSATSFTGSASAGVPEGVIGDDEQPPAIAAGPGHAGAPASSDVTAAVAAATQVVAGWLTADHTSRRDQLSGVAAEALIDAFDDPRYTPLAAGPVGPVHVVVAEPLRIVTRHRRDTGAAVDVTLIPEPTAFYGWIAVAIAEV